MIRQYPQKNAINGTEIVFSSMENSVAKPFSDNFKQNAERATADKKKKRDANTSKREKKSATLTSDVEKLYGKFKFEASSPPSRRRF